jgi:hypothetical protein
LIPILLLFIIGNGLWRYQKFSITDEGIYPPEKPVFPLGQKNLIIRSDILRVEIIVMKNAIVGLNIITTNNINFCIYGLSRNPPINTQGIPFSIL